MNREETIKAILGKRYPEGREIADIVLNYVAKNPDWIEGDRKGEIYKNSILNTIDRAIVAIYGHHLEYYLAPSRKREFLDVRQMAIYLFRKETGYSFHEVGEIFNKHHATIIYTCKEVESLMSVDRRFRQDYKLLEETYKNYL